MTEIHGEVAAGFEPVRDAFAKNFDSHEEVGAAFALYVKGTKVVDIWGGVADEATGRPWVEDTLQLVFSTTKGVTAICASLLAQRGELDLDAPVADYWPEFKAAGKENVPVRWLLGHRVGLPALHDTITPHEVLDWDTITSRLAAEEPWWEPGTIHGYHAMTYGWLVGEVIRRVSGKNIGRFVADELAAPLGLETYIGLPESKEPRVAPLVEMSLQGDAPAPEVLDAMPPEMRAAVDAFTNPNSLTQKALRVSDPALEWNSRAVHAAEIPAANGISDARSLAKLYAACIGEVDGVRILNPDTVADATKEVSNGPDKVLFAPTRFGSGFFLQSMFSPLYGPNSFGHAGAGGSLAMADPDAGIGYAYVMNKMQANLSGDPRTLGLTAAVKECLA
jgi:CubicO group peptidase (beta-lactamase class C family)